MADGLTKAGNADRDRINAYEPHEVRYWCQELGISAEKPRRTEENVGPMAADVRKALGK